MHDRTFTRLLAVSALALAAACSNEGASSSESAAPADTGLEGEAPADGGEMAASKEKLKTMRAQFAVVDMDADTSFLAEEERQVINKLNQVGVLMSEIYLRQRSAYDEMVGHSHHAVDNSMKLPLGREPLPEWLN